MEIRQNTSVAVPVTLVSASTGAGISGLAAGSVTVYIRKAGGSATPKNVSGVWEEISAAYMPGEYEIRLTSSDTDTAGFFQYWVSASGSQIYRGLLVITPSTTADIGGLLHLNSVVRNQTYTAGGRLASASLYVYDTPEHATLNDGITGVVSTYTIDCQYDVNNQQILYRLIFDPLA